MQKPLVWMSRGGMPALLRLLTTTMATWAASARASGTPGVGRRHADVNGRRVRRYVDPALAMGQHRGRRNRRQCLRTGSTLFIHRQVSRRTRGAGDLASAALRCDVKPLNDG